MASRVQKRSLQTMGPLAYYKSTYMILVINIITWNFERWKFSSWSNLVGWVSTPKLCNHKLLYLFSALSLKLLKVFYPNMPYYFIWCSTWLYMASYPSQVLLEPVNTPSFNIFLAIFADYFYINHITMSPCSILGFWRYGGCYLAQTFYYSTTPTKTQHSPSSQTNSQTLTNTPNQLCETNESERGLL